MAQIELTKGFVAIVDDSDFEELSKHKWFALTSKGNVYAVRDVTINGKRKHLLMHREILNPKHGFECDHINGNGIDNRRLNLRICTHKDNTRNKLRTSRTKKSKFKGVSKIGDRWIAYIRVNGDRKHIGSFKSEQNAAIAYNITAIREFGEFAGLNVAEE